MSKKLSEEELEIRKSRIKGLVIFGIAIVLFLIYFFIKDEGRFVFLLYVSIALTLVAVLFMLPINYYIFDICDLEERENIRSFIKKLRLRAIVFTNLSYLILIISVLVIIFSFYQLRTPHLNVPIDPNDKLGFNYLRMISQIGSVVVLIFLVQILFRVFKYLIRIGGFYNGKADALELTLLDKEKKYNDSYKTLESFTPQNYEISDVDSPNLMLSK